MNGIDLIWLVLFVGAGAAIGDRAWGLSGAIGGASAGLLLLYLVSRLNGWQSSQEPQCVCGASWQQMKIEQTEAPGGMQFIYRCRACGRDYIRSKGRYCESVAPDGTRTLVSRRGFLGRWKAVEN